MNSSSSRSATTLERRYRRLLMLLPRAYRDDRGEEMLTVLMDGAPENGRWPKPGEVLSLATHSVKLRSGLSADGVPPGAARPLVRAVALLGSLYLSFLNAISFVMGLRNWGIYQSDINHSDLDGHHHPFAEIVLVQVAGLLWLAAHIALLRGWRRTVRALGLTLLIIAVTQITGSYTALAALPALIVAGALITTGRRATEPATHARFWFAALAAGAVFAGYLDVVAAGVASRPTDVGPPAAVAAAVALTVASAAGLRAWGRSEWALAAAVVGGMAAAQRALDVNHYPVFGQGAFDSVLRLILIGETVLVLAALYALMRERRSAAAETGL